MGMRPSASLTYGIEIGEFSFDEPEEGAPSDLPWLTLELWQDSYEIGEASSAYLERQGIEDVWIENYGHCDYPAYVLTTRSIGSYGWQDVTTVTIEGLAVTDDDDRLKRAWELLFPGQRPGSIAWRLSATFG